MIRLLTEVTISVACAFGLVGLMFLGGMLIVEAIRLL